MKKIFFVFVLGLFSMGLLAQVPKVNQNVYGIRVKNRINMIVDTLNSELDSSDIFRSELDAVVDTNDVQTIFMNATRGRVAHLEGDTLGWLVADASIYGDGATNATTYIQGLLDQGDYHVYCPPGTYLIDSLRIDDSPRLSGAGASYYNRSGITVFKSTSNKPILTIDYSDVDYDYGNYVRGIIFRGSNSADSSNQHGIVFEQGTSTCEVEENYFYQLGGHCVYLARTGTVTNVDIINNQMTDCFQDGVYGKGYPAKQLNVIEIRDNFINRMGDNGIDVAGLKIDIDNNIIEDCDSTAILLTFDDLVDIAATAYAMTIRSTYTEGNGGGSIYAQMGSDGTYGHVFQGLTIEDNYFNDNTADITKPEVTAAITFDRDPDSQSWHYYFRDLKVGINSYLVTGLYKVDGASVLDDAAEIHFDYSSSPDDEFVNLGDAIIPFKNYRREQAIWTNPQDTAVVKEGMIYYDEDDNHFYGRNNSSWVQLDN